MSDQRRTMQRAAQDNPSGPHTASLRVEIGPVQLQGRVSISSRGLLAVAGLVSSILLSTAVVVLVATRKLPDDTLPADLSRD